MIKRLLGKKLKSTAQGFLSIMVTGPRQSGKTINEDFFKNLEYWRALAKDKAGTAYLVYGGKDNHKRSAATVVGWESVDRIFND